ncbi:MAG: caspase family protein, partial [Caldilineaceae bacterium]|nr:caspase family protein [Caldilineaceae bacterium]
MAPERGFRLIQQFVEEQPIYAKSWAICVGINEYQGGQGRLANAVNDAKAVAQLLRDTHCFEEVHTLYDSEATRSAITALLSDELPACTGQHDRLIFFFAGHGVTRQRVRGEGYRGYLIPANAESGKYADYIEMGELARACADIPAKHIFFILDCCFSGVAAVAARSEATPPKVLDDPYLRRITKKHAWQILTAGDSDDAVADSGLRPGHSVFTSVLLDGLAGAADTNSDGLMTATDLSAYVKPLVTLQSQVATGRSQVPFAGYLAGSGQGEFAFLLPTAELKAKVAGNAPAKPPENIVLSRRQIACPIDFDWITIPAGDFLMGS